MSGGPFLSVIIPVYNVEKYLARCLDSVLAQSFSDMEIICVDDGSTDSSPDILRAYAARDARIRLIHQKNRGIAAARNAGLDAAAGRYVAFVDSDDAVTPDIYKSIFSHCPEEAEGICFSAEEVSEPDAEKRFFSSGYFEVKFSGLVSLQDEDLFRLSATVWDKIFRRDRIEALGLRFPEGVWYEDNAFVWNYFAVCRNTFFLPDKLYLYYRRAGSFMSRSKSREHGLAFHYMKILQNIHEFWVSHHILPEKQPVFERLCLYFFRAAVSSCNPWETAGLVHALAERLHTWNLCPENNILHNIMYGKYSIMIGKFPFYTDIYSLKTLHGPEKIFYMGNSGPYKVIRIFGITVAFWKRRQSF